jgi:two-component system chemotaxis response regulator CheY
MDKSLYSIVIIDDSHFSREQIAKTLKENDFNVTGLFERPSDCISSLSEKQFNLAIIDVVMPKISGFDLAKRLKDYNSNIDIIMISSLSQERIILEAIASGAMDFIQKPIQEQILLDSVGKGFQIFSEKEL